MKAFLEISAGVIRVLPQDSEYGDVFDFAIFIIGDEDTATLKGLKMDDRRFTVHHRRALMKCLLDAGFSKACWDRYRMTERGPEKRKFMLELRTRKFTSSYLDRRNMTATG